MYLAYETRAQIRLIPLDISPGLAPASSYKPGLSPRRSTPTACQCEPMTSFCPAGNTISPTHARREWELKGATRKSMDKTLCESFLSDYSRASKLTACLVPASMSGIPGQKMKPFTYVYLALLINLVGWQPDVLFINLSDITSLARISRVASLLESGWMYFAPVNSLRSKIHTAAHLIPSTSASHRILAAATS